MDAHAHDRRSAGVDKSQRRSSVSHEARPLCGSCVCFGWSDPQMDLDSSDGGLGGEVPEFDKQAEYNAIRKDAEELDAKLMALEKRIYADETEYFEMAMLGASSCNSLKGWENFLDVKLDGTTARVTKIPDSDRFFSNSSKKRMMVQSYVQPTEMTHGSTDSSVSRSVTPEPSTLKESKPEPKKRKRR